MNYPNIDFQFTTFNPQHQLQSPLKLPTPSTKFHPDFIETFNNPRLMIDKFTVSHFVGSNEGEEKELLKKVLAEKSGNLFLMAWKKNNQQIAR